MSKFSTQNTKDMDKNWAERAWRPVKVITLEKIQRDERPLPIGSIETYTYRDLMDSDARGRASKALKRIGENPMNWKEVK